MGLYNFIASPDVLCRGEAVPFIFGRLLQSLRLPSPKRSIGFVQAGSFAMTFVFRVL